MTFLSELFGISWLIVWLAGGAIIPVHYQKFFESHSSLYIGLFFFSWLVLFWVVRWLLGEWVKWTFKNL